jgi:hypothetical protein
MSRYPRPKRAEGGNRVRRTSLVNLASAQPKIPGYMPYAKPAVDGSPIFVIKRSDGTIRQAMSPGKDAIYRTLVIDRASWLAQTSVMDSMTFMTRLTYTENEETKLRTTLIVEPVSRIVGLGIARFNGEMSDLVSFVFELSNLFEADVVPLQVTQIHGERFSFTEHSVDVKSHGVNETLKDLATAYDSTFARGLDGISMFAPLLHELASNGQIGLELTDGIVNEKSISDIVQRFRSHSPRTARQLDASSKPPCDPDSKDNAKMSVEAAAAIVGIGIGSRGGLGGAIVGGLVGLVVGHKFGAYVDSQCDQWSGGSSSSPGGSSCSGGGGGGGCLTSKTVVHTPSGNTEIAKLLPGDVVIGYDLKKKRYAVQVVISKKTQKSRRTLKLSLKRDSVVCTPEHPFFANGWTIAGNLKKGDHIFCRHGNGIEITGCHRQSGTHNVFDISAKPSECYFIGSSGILAHNKKSQKEFYGDDTEECKESDSDD